MDLQSFDAKLRTLAGDRSRPFICGGNPLDCKAFIVGANSASKVAFWKFWKVETGFERENWLECYRSARSKDGKAPTSPTRQRIDKIVGAAAPAKILETNLYSVATPREADLRKEDKQLAVLEFLLSSISPRVILVHGASARRHFEKCRHKSRGALDTFFRRRIGRQAIQGYGGQAPFPRGVRRSNQVGERDPSRRIRGAVGG